MTVSETICTSVDAPGFGLVFAGFVIHYYFGRVIGRFIHTENPMGRPSKPYWRADRGSWVCTIHGKQYTLARGRGNRKTAMATFRTLMSEVSSARQPTAVLALDSLAESFLDHAQENTAPMTYEFYRRHIAEFVNFVGLTHAATSVRPHHVTAWIATHQWNDTTRASAISAIKRLFSWARKQGFLEGDRLSGMEKPTPLSRGPIMTRPQAEALVESAEDQNLRQILRFLLETGCRPNEAMKFEGYMLDQESSCVVMPSKTTRRTRKPRIIYLNPTALQLAVDRAARFAEGPIFRTADGAPWTRDVLCKRVYRLRGPLGLGHEATPGAFRHLFVTDALEREVPIATVAELVGHTTTTMTARHYSHLYDRKDHLRGALARVRPGKKSPTD